jgi:hypothetical protein
MWAWAPSGRGEPAAADRRRTRPRSRAPTRAPPKRASHHAQIFVRHLLIRRGLGLRLQPGGLFLGADQVQLLVVVRVAGRRRSRRGGRFGGLLVVSGRRAAPPRLIRVRSLSAARALGAGNRNVAVVHRWVV